MLVKAVPYEQLIALVTVEWRQVNALHTICYDYDDNDSLPQSQHYLCLVARDRGCAQKLV
jgi:hypothetical protein